MKGAPLVPGDMGHDTARGWHAGARADCPHCDPLPPPSPPASSVPVPPAEIRCPTGKRPFATRRVAMGSYHSVQRNRGDRLGPRPYRCALCLCWHVGNRRSNSSKSRGRR
jgi:hypothetical protein